MMNPGLGAHMTEEVPWGWLYRRVGPPHWEVRITEPASIVPTTVIGA